MASSTSRAMTTTTTRQQHSSHGLLGPLQLDVVRGVLLPMLTDWEVVQLGSVNRAWRALLHTPEVWAKRDALTRGDCGLDYGTNDEVDDGAMRDPLIWPNDYRLENHGYGINRSAFRFLGKRLEGTEGACYKVLHRGTGSLLAVRRVRSARLVYAPPYYALRQLQLHDSMGFCPVVSRVLGVALRANQFRTFYRYETFSLQDALFRRVVSESAADATESGAQAQAQEQAQAQAQEEPSPDDDAENPDESNSSSVSSTSSSSSDPPSEDAEMEDDAAAPAVVPVAPTHSPINTSLNDSTTSHNQPRGVYDHSCGIPLPLAATRRVLYFLLRGVYECHMRGVAHRNIKPKHILLRRSPVGCAAAVSSPTDAFVPRTDAEPTGLVELDQLMSSIAVLADFSLVRYVGCDDAFAVPAAGELDDTAEPNDVTPNVTTLWYRSPEVLLGGRQTLAIDMWAVGCVFVEMLTGRVVFPGGSVVDQIFMILSKMGTPTREDWPGFHELPDVKNLCLPAWPRQGALARAVPGWHELPTWSGAGSSRDMVAAAKDLASRMLELNPHSRISARHALLHPFFDPVRDAYEAELAATADIDRAVSTTRTSAWPFPAFVPTKGLTPLLPPSTSTSSTTSLTTPLDMLRASLTARRPRSRPLPLPVATWPRVRPGSAASASPSVAESGVVTRVIFRAFFAPVGAVPSPLTTSATVAAGTDVLVAQLRTRRAEDVAWLFTNVGGRWSVADRTLHAAVDLYDRFVAHTLGLVRPEATVLVMAACAMLSTKADDNIQLPSAGVADLLPPRLALGAPHVPGGGFQPPSLRTWHAVIRMEEFIALTMNFSLAVKGGVAADVCADVCSRLVPSCGASNGVPLVKAARRAASAAMFRALAMYLADVGVASTSLAGTDAALLGGCAALLAGCYTESENAPAWVDRFSGGCFVHEARRVVRVTREALGLVLVKPEETGRAADQEEVDAWVACVSALHESWRGDTSPAEEAAQGVVCARWSRADRLSIPSRVAATDVPLARVVARLRGGCTCAACRARVVVDAVDADRGSSTVDTVTTNAADKAKRARLSQGGSSLSSSSSASSSSAAVPVGMDAPPS